MNAIMYSDKKNNNIHVLEKESFILKIINL